jgi:hypothetical protein
MIRMVYHRQHVPTSGAGMTSWACVAHRIFRSGKEQIKNKQQEKGMKKNLLLIAGAVGAMCVAAVNVLAQDAAGGPAAAAGVAAGAAMSAGGATPNAGMGMGGGFGRNFGGGGAPAGSQASVAVTAVADDRANAVVVKATDETLKKIQDLVKELDVSMGEDLEWRVYHLTNADSGEVASQISTLFGTSSSSSTQSGSFGQGGGNSVFSDRLSRMATVIALPDPRTGALIVAASKSLLPKIEGLLLQLDSDPGYKETVGFFELQHADVQDAYAVLSDLFNRTSVRMQSSANNNPLVGANNPLTQRLNSLSSSTSTSFGTSSSSSTGSRTGTASTGF